MSQLSKNVEYLEKKGSHKNPTKEVALSFEIVASDEPGGNRNRITNINAHKYQWLLLYALYAGH